MEKTYKRPDDYYKGNCKDCGKQITKYSKSGYCKKCVQQLFNDSKREIMREKMKGNTLRRDNHFKWIK